MLVLLDDDWVKSMLGKGRFAGVSARRRGTVSRGRWRCHSCSSCHKELILEVAPLRILPSLSQFARKFMIFAKMRMARLQYASMSPVAATDSTESSSTQSSVDMSVISPIINAAQISESLVSSSRAAAVKPRSPTYLFWQMPRNTHSQCLCSSRSTCAVSRVLRTPRIVNSALHAKIFWQ